MEKETIILDFKVDGKEAIVSIENLTKANKELREERKKLDLQSEEGLARAKELNAQIDNNTNIIKTNSSALEKQRLNVGNYKDSIKDAAKEINIAGVSVSSLSAKFDLLSKNPLLLVITALGLAFGALTAYFKGSEEGQDALGRGTQVLKGIFQSLTVVVEQVGKAVFAAFEFMFSGFQKLLDFVAPAMGAILKNVIDTGVAIAKMEEELGDIEDDLIVKRAETAKKVSELRSKAISQEGAERKKTIQEAIALEEELAAKEVELAQKSLNYFLADQKTRGAITGEEKTKIAELEAAVINAEAQKFQATLRFTKELEKLDDEARKKKEDAILKEDEAAIKKETEHQRELARIQEVEDKLLQSALKRVENSTTLNDETQSINLASLDEYLNNESALYDKQYEYLAANERKKVVITRMAEQQKVSAISQSLTLAAGLVEKDSAEYKALAITKALVDTYVAATTALTAGPYIGAILAALTIATGLSNVAKIAGFKQGGYTGDMDTNQVAGVTHGKEFVMPASVVQQYGKDHFQSYMDGSIVANSMAASSGGQGQTPTVYLSYKEFSDFQDRVKYKEEMSAA